MLSFAGFYSFIISYVTSGGKGILQTGYVKIPRRRRQCNFFEMYSKRLKNNRQTRIVGKGGLWVTSFIYKYKTSTTYPLYETMRCFVLINK